MNRSKIAPNGPEISAMAHGPWRWLDEPLSAQDANRNLDPCLDLGITTIDTAEIYGGYHTEAVLGAAIALSPGLIDKLEIVTKFDIYVPTDDYPPARPDITMSVPLRWPPASTTLCG